MDRMTFLVQGSANVPYEVKFVKEGSNLSATCTCPAGVNGLYCKHRFNIMKGLNVDIVSQNKGDAEIVKSWLVDTDVEKALIDVDDKEKILERATHDLSVAKKKPAKVLRD